MQKVQVPLVQCLVGPAFHVHHVLEVGCSRNHQVLQHFVREEDRVFQVYLLTSASIAQGDDSHVGFWNPGVPGGCLWRSLATFL